MRKWSLSRSLSGIGVALAIGLAAVGCGGGDSASSDGGTTASATLRIGTDDVPGTPAADQIEQFASRVDRLSDGELRIEPVWHAAGDGPDWDQRVAGMVTSGELELGLIPARAWDAEGVTTLRALNAPFLITSDQLADEVVSGELADELLAGLNKAGVVGLALFPEGLRHPFGFGRPLLGPEDYAGEAIFTPTSATTTEVFRALGARADDREPPASGHIGMESSYVLAATATATGDVVLYPKVNSLVANAGAFDQLDDRQREILERAAVETRQWAIEATPSDADAAEDFCERGGAIAAASGAQLVALERAVRPVYAELEDDATTKVLIERIRALKAEVPAPAGDPVRCGGGAPVSGSPSAAERTPVDGAYRWRLTDAELRAAGVSDPGEIDENHGVFSWTLSGGRYCFVQRAPNPLANPRECGSYDVDGDRLVMHYSFGEEVYRWRRTAEGDLELELLRPAPGGEAIARAWTTNTWERVGDGK